MKAQLKNLWHALKAVLRWKLIASEEYIRNEERSKSGNLCSHLRKLEKEEKIKSKNAEEKKKD